MREAFSETEGEESPTFQARPCVGPFTPVSWGQDMHSWSPSPGLTCTGPPASGDPQTLNPVRLQVWNPELLVSKCILRLIKKSGSLDLASTTLS